MLGCEGVSCWLWHDSENEANTFLHDCTNLSVYTVQSNHQLFNQLKVTLYSQVFIMINDNQNKEFCLEDCIYTGAKPQVLFYLSQVIT